jgi:hypothetical protein
MAKCESKEAEVTYTLTLSQKEADLIASVLYGVDNPIAAAIEHLLSDEGADPYVFNTSWDKDTDCLVLEE